MEKKRKKINPPVVLPAPQAEKGGLGRIKNLSGGNHMSVAIQLCRNGISSEVIGRSQKKSSSKIKP